MLQLLGRHPLAILAVWLLCAAGLFSSRALGFILWPWGAVIAIVLFPVLPLAWWAIERLRKD